MIKNPFIIIVAILSVTAFIGAYKFTNLQKVQIQGENLCITQEDLESKLLPSKKNLIFISTKAVEKDIMENFPCITNAKANVKLPNTLVFEISSESPIVDISDTSFSLTTAGFVVKSQNKSLAKIFLPETVVPTENEKVKDDKVLFALSLVKDLLKSDFTPTQVRFVDNIDIIIYSQTEAKAVFTTTKDHSAQVDSLQSVLAKAKMNASKISQIDLRFNKPVVTYKE